MSKHNYFNSKYLATILGLSTALASSSNASNTQQTVYRGSIIPEINRNSSEPNVNYRNDISSLLESTDLKVPEYKIVDSKDSKVSPKRMESIEEIINSHLVIDALNEAWKKANYGEGYNEAVFAVYRKLEGDLFLSKMEVSTSYDEHHFTMGGNIMPSAQALFHTHKNHPDFTLAYPARADRELSEKYGMPVVTITSRGLFWYEPNTHEIIALRKGLEWNHPKEEKFNIARKR